MINKNKNSVIVYGWIKPLIPPSIIPKSKPKLFAWGGSLYPFEFTKLSCLILKGLTRLETKAYLTTFKALCNKLIVLMCILLHKTNLIDGMYHKPTTLDILNECNNDPKVFPPHNVYVLAARAYSYKTDFLRLVQFRGILGHFDLFLPNICKGKQLKQIHLQTQHSLQQILLVC